MIPFILALSFSILLTLVFAIPGIILCIRWFAMFVNEHSDIGVGDMKIPTFYASELQSEKFRDAITCLICMPIVGVLFGGIHCTGWFFNFPSNDEAMLWRVCSAVLTGVAFLFPIVFGFLATLFGDSITSTDQWRYFAFSTFFVSILLVYVVSRLLLLVEAFISLRHLTPGMLALVKWTSFVPHI